MRKSRGSRRSGATSRAGASGLSVPDTSGSASGLPKGLVGVVAAVSVRISGKGFDVKAGDAIIMPADEPHALKAITPFKMLLTMIRG